MTERKGITNTMQEMFIVNPVCDFILNMQSFLHLSNFLLDEFFCWLNQYWKIPKLCKSTNCSFMIWKHHKFIMARTTDDYSYFNTIKCVEFMSLFQEFSLSFLVLNFRVSFTFNGRKLHFLVLARKEERYVCLGRDQMAMLLFLCFSLPRTGSYL